MHHFVAFDVHNRHSGLLALTHTLLPKDPILTPFTATPGVQDPFLRFGLQSDPRSTSTGVMQKTSAKANAGSDASWQV